MLPIEPIPTAILLTVFGGLMAVSVAFSRASERIGVPVALIFLVIGMLAGSEGIGGIEFTDYASAFRLGTVALVLILYDGGLNTPVSAARRYAAPAITLATIGVVATALLVALAGYMMGLAWPVALLLGATVSSTDAAAVFSVLRGSGIALKRRVGMTLELESGLNDPMALMLTIALTASLITGEPIGWSFAWAMVEQFAIGGAFGYAIGRAGRFVFERIRLPASGLFPALSLAFAFLAFGVPTLLHGSGFLSVYIAALVIGSGRLPYRVGIVRVHDAAAWLSQIAMFLVLGLLIFPSRLVDVAWIGLVIALFMAFIARPLVTAICLLPFRYPRVDIAYVGWVGLRGAVPIILATYPVLSGVAGGETIFDIVFFIVVVQALIPGGTVGWVTRRLGLESMEPPPPSAVLEIESLKPLKGDLHSFYVDELLAVNGSRVSDLPFPAGSAVTLIVRGEELVAPTQDTTLETGDHVYVISRDEDKGLIQLMFGRPEE
jgi:cell volume regulation protein A